jgi:hypothetical protein
LRNFAKRAREENKNFADLVIIDEAERLKPQGLEYLRELYDNGEANFLLVYQSHLIKLLKLFQRQFRIRKDREG